MPSQWVQGALPSGLKQSWPEADHSPPTSAEMDVYIHSPTRLHGVSLNYFISAQLYLLLSLLYCGFISYLLGLTRYVPAKANCYPERNKTVNLTERVAMKLHRSAY
jgi:hypothetical protein